MAAISALADVAPARFEREHGPDRWPAFLDAAARDVERFDANDHLRQAQAMMAHDVSAPFGGSLARAAAAVKARLLVVVTSSDRIVTPASSREFARAARAQLLELTNDCGHGGANCEFDRVRRAVSRFLR